MGRQTVTVTIGGKDYTGTYEINGGSVTVFYADDHKTTQLGGLRNHPDTLARNLLSELVRKSNP